MLLHSNHGVCNISTQVFKRQKEARSTECNKKCSLSLVIFVFFRFLSSGLEKKGYNKKQKSFRSSDLFPLQLLRLLLLATPQGHHGSFSTSKRPGLLWGLMFAYFCIVSNRKTSNPGLDHLVFDSLQLKLWKKIRMSLQVFVFTGSYLRRKAPSAMGSYPQISSSQVRQVNIL